MNDREWLENLGAGDRVVISHSGFGSRYDIRTVDRLTKTQIVIGSARYQKKTGNNVGGGAWCNSWLMEATPDFIGKIREANNKRKCVRTLNDTVWAQIDLDVLIKIIELLP